MTYSRNPPQSLNNNAETINTISANRIAVAIQGNLKILTRAFHTTKALADTFVNWGKKRPESLNHMKSLSRIIS